MKGASSILVLTIALLWAQNSIADRVLQHCEITQSSPKDAPLAVLEYANKHEGFAIKRCAQIDFKTETYFALGPVTKDEKVCHFTQDQISPALPEAPAKLQLMAHVENECPDRQSLLYVPAHNVSATDFAALTKYLEELSSSEDVFAKAVSDLSQSQREAVTSSSLRQALRQSRHLPIVRVGGTYRVVGIWSVFDVYVRAPYDAERFYVLTVRKLFGHLDLTAFSEGMS